jgi:hypothetical protein
MRALPYVAAAVVLAFGALAFFRTDRPPEPASRASEVAPPVAEPARGEPEAIAEPEPPADRGADNAPAHGPMGVENEDPATLAWTVPTAWREVPNPNPMRLATFRVAGNATSAGAGAGSDDAPEVSVARAGGTPEANIARWVGQFEGASTPKRTDKKVHGIDVTIVEVTGTYSAGGGMMMPGAPTAPRPDWTLVGAIAQPPKAGGSTYFFKLLGPAAKVRDARASFDAFVASLKPR